MESYAAPGIRIIEILGIKGAYKQRTEVMGMGRRLLILNFKSKYNI